jgi:hypothetical protein
MLRCVNLDPRNSTAKEFYGRYDWLVYSNSKREPPLAKTGKLAYQNTLKTAKVMENTIASSSKRLTEPVTKLVKEGTERLETQIEDNLRKSMPSIPLIPEQEKSNKQSD